MTINFDKNSSSCDCQLSSTVQGTSKETESRGGGTSRSRES